MRYRLWGSLAAAALAVTGPTTAAGSEPRRDEVVAMVERVKSAVVNIHSERVSAGDDAFSRAAGPQRINGMGTGIVLDPRGIIVTNYHVVDDVLSLRVHLVGGEHCPARVIALDKESDLALIQIDPPSPLPVAPLGTASDLMLAERVVAIGNAYGYEHTVSVGHVSALKRDVTLNKEISYKSLIQTQTPINPGNSGGPLLNRLGEVVGVNVAIRAGAQNIAFAIPVDAMITKASEMLAGKRRSGARFGLSVENGFTRAGEDSPLRRYVRVRQVEPGSAADDAGVKPGDTLERVGEVSVATTIDLERATYDRPARASWPLVVRRGGEAVELALANRPAVTPAAGQLAGLNASTGDLAARRLGLKLAPVGAEFVAAANPQLRGGLLVQDVVPNSVAARAGVSKGEILVGLHLWESLSLDNVNFVLSHKDLASFSPLEAFLARDGRVRKVALGVGE